MSAGCPAGFRRGGDDGLRRRLGLRFWLRRHYGGGIYRPSDAMRQGDVSTNAFDDFFEYALTQPVTIHKNESAMVPILQQELPAEHVTLWSESESHAAPRRLAGEQIQAHARLGQLLHLRERRVRRRGSARPHPSRRKAAALLRRRPGRPREGDGPRQPAHPASREDRQGRGHRDPHGCGLGDLFGCQPRRSGPHGSAGAPAPQQRLDAWTRG